jgi:hypothetical protein
MKRDKKTQIHLTPLHIQLAFVRRDGALMTSSEKSAIESSVIPVLGRPRNINRRPRKNQLRIEPTSDSNDYDQLGMYSGSSSPIRDELNEESSNSSSDETEIYFNSTAMRIPISKTEIDGRPLCYSHSTSSFNSSKIAPDLLLMPAFPIDDFCYYGDFEVSYDSIFLPTDESLPCHVDGDDWHDVLSYFCENEEGM